MIFGPEYFTSPKINVNWQQLIQTNTLESSFDFLYDEVKELQGKRILSFIEKSMIKRAISDTGGNQAKAAEILGITRNTLKKRLDEYAAEVSDSDD